MFTKVKWKLIDSQVQKEKYVQDAKWLGWKIYNWG